MTHVVCPSCRLRFTPAAAASLVACPECGRALQPLVGAADVVGFRVFVPEDAPHDQPEAAAIALRIDPPGGWL